MMKKKMKSKALAILMSLAMVFTMIPMMGTPVYAADPAPAAICLANGTAPNITGGQEDNIYFGHYPQSEAGSVEGLKEGVDYIREGDKNYLIEPIRWRVLDNPVDVNGNLLDKLILLSDQNLDCRKYNEVYTGITWEHSTIRAWLNGTSTKGGTPCTDYYAKLWEDQDFDYEDDSFIGAAFSSDEREVIFYTGVKNKETDQYTPNPYNEDTDGGNDTVDRIYLLSVNDAQNDAYGFTDDADITTTREAKNTAYATGQGAGTYNAGKGDWWLRSPGNDANDAVFVNSPGYLRYLGISVSNSGTAVRPAFNLNLSSALFTSAAVGGKSSGAAGAGSLKEVGTNETNEWKMTVKDKAHKEFKVESVSTCDGKTLNIKYSGAVVEKGEYISAIITDQFDDIKYYGNLIEFADRDSAPDTAEVTIDGKMESTDTLYVINEQLNGDKKTDFSSPLQEVAIPTTYHELVKTDKVEPTCTEKGWEEYWTCESCGVMFSDKDGKTRITEPEDISATGHKYGAWTKLNATQHQKVCQHDKSHVVKENHKWDAGKVTKKATEKETGVKTRTCTACKATKTETIPKLKPSAPKVSGTLLARMTAEDETGMTISWNRIRGAAGYDIFLSRCSHNGRKITCRKVNSIEGNETFKWAKAGLRKATPYKAYVKAYVMKNGRKSYVRTSPLIHAYTGNGTKFFTNAGSVSVNKTRVTLKKGRTFRIKAKVSKVNKNRKLMGKWHAPRLRYRTSNKKIATVSESGRIKARSTGSCRVYVYAHNGVKQSIKVTVK